MHLDLNLYKKNGNELECAHYGNELIYQIFTAYATNTAIFLLIYQKMCPIWIIHMCVFSAPNANFCIKMWFYFNPTFPLFMKVCAPTNQGTREEKFCPRAFQSYLFIAPRRYLEKDVIVIRQISTVCLTHFSPPYSLSGTMKREEKYILTKVEK